MLALHCLTSITQPITEPLSPAFLCSQIDSSLLSVESLFWVQTDFSSQLISWPDETLKCLRTNRAVYWLNLNAGCSWIKTFLLLPRVSPAWLSVLAPLLSIICGFSAPQHTVTENLQFSICDTLVLLKVTDDLLTLR